MSDTDIRRIGFNTLKLLVASVVVAVTALAIQYLLNSFGIQLDVFSKSEVVSVVLISAGVYGFIKMFEN
jgi:hypothetical protein